MTAPVLTPTGGVDPRDALATSMAAAPGIYAFLVGSGVSTAAGVFTGYRIMQDLVRKIAANRGQHDLDDPLAWWEATTGESARYDSLLEQLAPTEEARKILLRAYLERHPVTGEPIVPTAAHHALAVLCARGLVKVILTTNFDRLIEQALAAEGVVPQVLASDAEMAARTPFVHSPVTVVKLHGDQLGHGLRNTVEELSAYGPGAQALLAQVFDEYGLVVVGWSAEWDQALVSELTRSASRRYPLYWASYHGDMTAVAGRIVAARGGHHVATSGADEFLPDLVERTERLARISRRRRGPRRSEPRQLPSSVPPSGWAVMPLLVVRASSFASDDGRPMSPAGPVHRKALVSAISEDGVTGLLRELSGWAPAWADPSRTEPPERPLLVRWEPCAEYQSTSQLRYQIGGDGSVGVAAILDVILPRRPGRRDIQVTCDMGFSLEAPLALFNVARLFGRALVTATATVFESLADVLPEGVEAGHCEMHLLATNLSDGSTKQRENHLGLRVDMAALDGFGLPSPPAAGQMGFAADIDGPLTSADAVDLALDALRLMVLDHGYLDPTIGLRSMYVAMGRTYPDDQAP